MHLTLCSCFQSLRRENYIVVWSNLIYKRYTKYANRSYKELYFALYGAKGTKAERELHRMDTIEIREKEQNMLKSEIDSSSDEDGENDVDDFDYQDVKTTTCGPRRVIPEVIAQEEAECRKYVYIGQAVDSEADLQLSHRETKTGSDFATPVRPSRPSKEPPASVNSLCGSPCNAELRRPINSNSNVGNCGTTFKDAVPVRPTIYNENEKSKNTWNRIVTSIPKLLKSTCVEKKISKENAFDILAPNYTNTYDILDEKKRERRAKRDRKALTQRLRRRRREELRELARQERRRKKIADSIELLLQLLRMMTSFAVLVGNIRKTFIPAQFKYLKPGQHAYDNYELLLLFRVTTFLDVSMFWTNVMWVYCLQWHLCCRLGLLRFWVWLAILSVVAIAVMLAPMSYAMNELDLSWCRFRVNSTLEKYQPKW